MWLVRCPFPFLRAPAPDPDFPSVRGGTFLNSANLISSPHSGAFPEEPALFLTTTPFEFSDDPLVFLMVVCVCHYDLLLLDRPDSLKGKRHVVKSLKERLRSRFGVSVAEVGSHELLHRGELGIAFVGERQDLLESVAQELRNLIESDGRVEVLSSMVDYHRY